MLPKRIGYLLRKAPHPSGTLSSLTYPEIRINSLCVQQAATTTGRSPRRSRQRRREGRPRKLTESYTIGLLSELPGHVALLLCQNSKAVKIFVCLAAIGFHDSSQ